MEQVSEGKNFNTITTPSLQNSRVDYIDIGRGLLIMLVVLGHSSFPYSRFLYWFHMPAFFIISGMLHTQPKKTGDFLSKRIFNLLIPYIAYGTLIAFISYVFYTDRWELYDLAHSQAVSTYNLLFWGGGVLKGNFAVFWFINCFLLTIVAFTLAKSWFKNDLVIIIKATLSFVGGYILNLYIDRSMTPTALPWVLNVVPYAFTYFVLGYYTKAVLKRIHDVSIYITTLSILIGIILIFLGLSNNLSFKVDMKYGDISNPMLGLLIPIHFTVLILILSANIKQAKLKEFLTYIGKNTLPIMYLHIVSNFVFHKIYGEAPESYLFLLIGLFVPLFLTLFLRRYELTRMLFLGNNSKGLLNFIPLKNKVKKY